MGERESRVIYKTRTLEKGEDRPRVPTAFDPYDNPSVLELPSHRRVSTRNSLRDSSSTLGENTSTTEIARSTTRTSRQDDRNRDVYGDSRKSSRVEYPTETNPVKKSDMVDWGRDETSNRQRGSVTESRANRDRNYVDIDGDRSRGRSRGLYTDDRLRPIGAPYVIETRPGELIDISIAGRDGNRIYDRDARRYVYDDVRSSQSNKYDRDYDRKLYARSTEDVRSGSSVTKKTDYPPTKTRSRYDDDLRSSNSRQRDYESSREDEWRLVDSMRDTRIGSPQTRDNYSERTSRSRAQTYDSEDSYVMVSPTKSAKPRASSSARSAIARTDYSGPDLRRRRSRSISFRDSQVQNHDASERKHERPGAEAQISGQYLRQSESDYDSRVDTYAAYNESDRRSRIADSDRVSTTYRERDEPYGPQRGQEPRRRERSRRRRHDDEYDDDSQFSETITRKTTRETYR